MKSEKTPSNKNSSSLGRIGCCVSLIVFIFLVLSGTNWFAEFLIALFTGWFSFLWNNLKGIHFNWEMIACGVVALVMGTYGLHKIASWLRKDQVWHWKWTLSIVSLTLFLFAASIAMTGIIHQSAWLVKSPIIEHTSRKRANRTKAVGHGTQVKIALIEYQEKHGKYPENLDQAMKLYPKSSGAIFYVPTKNGLAPWIYFGDWHNHHKSEQDLKTLPIILSPQPYGDKFVVLDTEYNINTPTAEKLAETYPKLLKEMPHLFQQKEVR